MGLVITSRRLMSKLNNIRLELSKTVDEKTGEVKHTAKVAGFDIQGEGDTPEHAIREAKNAAKANVLKDGIGPLHTKTI